MKYQLVEVDSNNKVITILYKKANTKKQINDWCECMIQAHGLDWRVGYLIKFKNSNIIYDWQNIKSGKFVKYA